MKNMEQGRLLVIVDGARVSRLICHVAELFEMSWFAINKTNDISAAYKKFRPDLILLDPEPSETQGSETQGSETQESETQDSESQGSEPQGRNVLRKLAEHHSNATIVLTSSSHDQTRQLEDLGDSLGLNMAGVLPDVFDADILKQEFISIFQCVGQ